MPIDKKEDGEPKCNVIEVISKDIREKATNLGIPENSFQPGVIIKIVQILGQQSVKRATMGYARTIPDEAITKETPDPGDIQPPIKPQNSDTKSEDHFPAANQGHHRANVNKESQKKKPRKNKHNVDELKASEQKTSNSNTSKNSSVPWLFLVGCVGFYGCNADIKVAVISNPVILFTNVELSCYRMDARNVSYFSWMIRPDENAKFSYIKKSNSMKYPKYSEDIYHNGNGLEYHLQINNFNQTDAMAEFRCEIGLESKTVNLSALMTPLFSLPNNDRILVNKSMGKENVFIVMKEQLPPPECQIIFTTGHTEKIDWQIEKHFLTFDGYYHVPEDNFNDTCTPFTIHCVTNGVDQPFNLTDKICKEDNAEKKDEERYYIYIIVGLLLFVFIFVSIGTVVFRKCQQKKRRRQVPEDLKLMNSDVEKPEDNK